MLVVADPGIQRVLTELRTNWNATPLHLHLFKNNYTPTNATILANLTESTFAGYAAVDLITWAAPSVAAHVATMSAAARTFTRSSSGTGEPVYGYFVTLADDTTLLWAERDPVADTSGVVYLTSAGDTYTVTPSFNSRDLNT